MPPILTIASAVLSNAVDAWESGRARAQAIVMSVAAARVHGYDDGPLDSVPVMVAGLVGYVAGGTVGAFGASFVAGIARAAFHDAIDAPIARRKREAKS